MFDKIAVYFDKAFDFLSGNKYHNVTAYVSDSQNTTHQYWNVWIDNVVNRLWTVNYASPTPNDSAVLSVNSFNVSVEILPGVAEESSAVLVFHGNQSSFNGTYNYVYYNGTTNSTQLSYANLTGTYASQIIDAGKDAAWDNLSWNGLVPSDGELAAQQVHAALWHRNND